jgi:hypothetical protein
MVKVADREPLAAGLNTTLIVQLLPGASVPGLIGQVVVGEKSAASAPASAMLLIVRAVVGIFPSVFLRVMVLTALDVPVLWFPKLRLFVLNAA